MSRFILSIFIVILLAAPQRGDGGVIVWYQVSPLTANALVDQHGGQFSSNNIELRCDKVAGDCSWLVTANLRVVSGVLGRYDLYLRDPAGNATDLNVAQTSVFGSPFSSVVFLQENAPDGYVSRVIADAPVAVSASPDAHFIHSFVLTKTGQDLSGTTTLIAGSALGFTGFEPETLDFFHTTRVGFNMAYQVDGFPHEWANPVITITNTPEPGTAGLVGVGAVMLVRRRSVRGSR